MGLFLYQQRRKEAWLYLLHTGLSFLTVLLPFFLYFLYTHTLGDFISVYFSFVTETYQVGAPSSLLVLFVFFINDYCLNVYALPLWLSLGCILPYSPLASRTVFKDEPAIRLWLITLIISTCIAGSSFMWTCINVHYYSYIYTPLSIVATIGATSAVRKGISSFTLGVFSCVVMVASTQLNRSSNGEVCSLIYPPPEQDILIEKELLGKDNPKVLYWGILEQGYGIAAHALPAVSCWSGLNMATDEFKAAQEQAVRDRKADYVFCRYQDERGMIKTDSREFKPQNRTINCRELLEASGYEFLYMTKSSDIPISLWRKIPS